MEEIVLFINDLENTATLEKDLDMITLDPSKQELCIDYAWVGPNGIGDSSHETFPLEDLRIKTIYETLNHLFDHLVTMEDLLLNDSLIAFYNEHDDQDLLEDVNHSFLVMLNTNWFTRETEDDTIDLAILCQSYGRFLEAYDFPKCIDAYMREKDLLEDVASENPTDENKHNAIVGYEDIIRTFEYLGDDFAKDTLDLYLSLYQARLDYAPDYDYALGHICEKIGLLIDQVGTDLDVDEIDKEVEQIKLSIVYHKKECEIFKSLYELNHDDEDAYNYGIALRQLGLRYKELGDVSSLQIAFDYFQKAYEIFEELYQKRDDCRDTYIIALEHLGDIYYLMEQYDEAKDAYERVYAFEKEDMEKSLDDLFSMAVIEKKLGHTYKHLKQYEKAKTCYQKAIKVTQKVASEDPTYEHQSEEGIAYMNLGWLYMEVKDYEQAKDCFEKDLAIREALDEKYDNKSSHYSLSLAQRHMGYAYEETSHEEEALVYFQKCKSISEATMGDPATYRETYYDMVSAHDLAYCLKNLGRDQEALPLYEQVIHFLELKEDGRPHEYVLHLDEIKQEYETLKEAMK